MTKILWRMIPVLAVVAMLALLVYAAASTGHTTIPLYG